MRQIMRNYDFEFAGFHSSFKNFTQKNFYFVLFFFLPCKSRNAKWCGNSEILRGNFSTQPGGLRLSTLLIFSVKNKQKQGKIGVWIFTIGVFNIYFSAYLN